MSCRFASQSIYWRRLEEQLKKRYGFLCDNNMFSFFEPFFGTSHNVVQTMNGIALKKCLSKMRNTKEHTLWKTSRNACGTLISGLLSKESKISLKQNIASSCSLILYVYGFPAISKAVRPKTQNGEIPFSPGLTQSLVPLMLCPVRK